LFCIARRGSSRIESAKRERQLWKSRNSRWVFSPDNCRDPNDPSGLESEYIFQVGNKAKANGVISYGYEDGV
jgi:hypothetical protein